MKLTNKIAIELYVIASKKDYPHIRDVIFPALSEEFGVPILVNAFVSLEKKEELAPPSSTGGFYLACEPLKLPLSLSKMLSTNVSKLNVPAIFSTSKDIKEISDQIKTEIPAFSMYSEATKLLKKGFYPKAFSFESFQNLVLSIPDKALDLYPCDYDNSYNAKEHSDFVLSFIKDAVSSHSNENVVMTPHLFLQYLKDIPLLLESGAQTSFVVQFQKNWINCLVNKYIDQDFSFFETIYTKHFESELTTDLIKHLWSLPIKRTEITKFNLELDGLSLTYSKGVSLKIKEISSKSLSTDGSITIESTNQNKIYNLSLT